jgi:hypothetical protein
MGLLSITAACSASPFAREAVTTGCGICAAPLAIFSPLSNTPAALGLPSKALEVVA